ncbi:MAG: NosD domain-containing protein, partial [Candidatus Sigynarchaeota archaeon]
TNITIAGNVIQGYETGIIISDVAAVHVFNNTIIHCGTGISCTNVDALLIEKNTLDSNIGYAVVLGSLVTNATITGNAFLNNNNGGVQALDNSAGGSWAGNYWSDYMARYPNATSTAGIWDEPYVVDGSAGASDGAPAVYAPSDSIGTKLSALDAHLGILEGLIDGLSNHGKRTACMNHL